MGELIRLLKVLLFRGIKNLYSVECCVVGYTISLKIRRWNGNFTLVMNKIASAYSVCALDTKWVIVALEKKQWRDNWTVC